MLWMGAMWEREHPYMRAYGTRVCMHLGLDEVESCIFITIAVTICGRDESSSYFKIVVIHVTAVLPRPIFCT
jgi:hypothetical protein